MRRLIPLLFAGCVAWTAPLHAQTPTLLFDYVGFDYEYPDVDLGQFGGIGDGYEGVGEVPVLYAPLVSNPAVYQYTYFFDGLTASSRQVIGSFVIIDYTGPGTLTVYEDPLVGGTAADYGTDPPSAVAPPTFVDGTPILVGELTNFQFVIDTGTNTGSFEATFEATGGTQLGNIPLDQRIGWTFAGATGNSTTIPNGYDHQIDGQTFLQAPTATRTGTWGGIKARYR